MNDLLGFGKFDECSQNLEPNLQISVLFSIFLKQSRNTDKISSTLRLKWEQHLLKNNFIEIILFQLAKQVGHFLRKFYDFSDATVFQRCTIMHTKCVNLIDLVKSFLTSIYQLVAKIDFDKAENEQFNSHNFRSIQGVNFHRGVVSELRSPI